jgi:thiamine pyrophosphate-dependent acetolactate synthase large subunit-like protein
MEEAITVAASGVPGPVYLEMPVDILYPESIVKQWYGLKSKSKSMSWWMSTYLNWSVNRIFSDKDREYVKIKEIPEELDLNIHISYLAEITSNAKKPVLLIGSQSILFSEQNESIAKTVKKINIPTFVSGMARGLISQSDLPIFRHERTKALKEADLVILAGIPCDFRLDYGRMINHQATIISINLSHIDMNMNRRPTKGIQTNPGSFLIEWGNFVNKSNQTKWKIWHQTLSENNHKRCETIKSQSQIKVEYINPLKLCMEINTHIQKGDIIIADGGDFVATASYILRPRSIYGWMDSGVFGTLGVGAGFILGAKLTHPDSIVWAIYGDGAFGYSLMEFDTFVRHNIPVISIIGNDAGWSQISRDQVDILHDPISTELAATDYHKAVEALGGKGYFIDNETHINEILLQAKESAISGKPTVVNVRLGKSDFRKGSISI